MRAEAMTLVGAAAGAAGGRKAMKEKTITVSHEVSPEYGKCSAAGAGTQETWISDSVGENLKNGENIIKKT